MMLHLGQPLPTHDLWSAWDLNPATVVPLALSAILYHRGARGGMRRQAVYFWSGWLALVFAVASPLHALGEVLFSAHMVQHEILMLAAAPLLVLSRPMVPMLRGLPASWRRPAGRWSKLGAIHPWAAWSIHAAALWLWHIPSWFQATLWNPWIHAAQHVSFLGSALLFWWSLLAADRAGFGMGMLLLFTTSVHTSMLGALLTFTRQVWYPAYRWTEVWGVSAIEDQQLGGLIMWIPAGIVYVAAGLAMFALWLRECDRMANRSRYAD
jgi:putative membrane protein